MAQVVIRSGLAAGLCIVLSGAAGAAPGEQESCPFDVHALGPKDLRSRLAGLSPRQFSPCADMLLSAGDPVSRAEVTRRAAQLLGSPDKYDRLEGIAILGKSGDRGHVFDLTGALSDRDIDVRHNAVRALKDLRDSRAVRPLARMLRDPYLYRDAIDAVGAIGGPEAGDVLADLARDKKLDIYRREEAATALRVMGDPRASAILREVESASRPPWEYLLVFPPLILWLNWRAAKADVARGQERRLLVYLVCAVSMIFVAPLWFGPEGRDLRTLFGALALGLPVGTTLAGVFVGVILTGRRPEVGSAFLRRVPALPLAMWGGLVFWMVAFVVAFIIGMGRVHA